MSTRLIRRSLQFNHQPFYLVHPEGDDSVFGVISCLSNGKFHLEQVPFAPNDVVVDIGSNVGGLSLAVAKARPDIRVLAFDASALSIHCLRNGCLENRLTNIESFHVAVGASAQRGLSFFSNGKDTSCLVREGLNSSNPVLDSTCNMIAIDELFDSNLFGLDRVRYLKMDIEGGEFEIFDRLFTHRPDILDRIDYLHLEVHPYPQYDTEGLKEKLRARFGDRLFLDT
jgi:FkbM family methyltransferase